MKQKIKKLSKKENQRILCEVVNVFMQNEVNDNYEIIKMFSQLNPDKLRGVKRSLTEKKKKLSRASKKPMDHLKSQENGCVVGLDLKGKMGEIVMRRLQEKKSPVEQTTPKTPTRAQGARPRQSSSRRTSRQHRSGAPLAAGF